MRRSACLSLIALGTCLVAAVPAQAQETPTLGGPYTLLTQNEQSLLYLANGSFRRSGDIAYATSLIAITTERMAATGNISHMAMATEVNCASNTTRITYGTGFYADGTVAGNTPGNVEWGPIDPTSPAGEIRDIACNGASPRGRALGNDPTAIANAWRQ